MSIEQIVAKSTAASGSLPETVSFAPTHMPERLDKPETDANETRGGIVASLGAVRSARHHPLDYARPAGEAKQLRIVRIAQIIAFRPRALLLSVGSPHRQ